MTNNNVKVISIGNISLGGTGKTPHTLLIADEFVKKGEKVAILSLGYKGKLGYDINVISDGLGNIFHYPPLAADEPYMIAKNNEKLVVITGKKREEALLVARDKYNITMAILDDGYQYKSLKRDANILLLDYKRPISTGLIFPFGYLRETPSAIARSDIIIFTRAEAHHIPNEAKPYINRQSIYYSSPTFNKIIFKNKEINIDDLKGENIACYSAIAGNKSFYYNLKNMGFEIKFFKSFQDHKILSEKAINKIISSGKNNGASLFITTEKDFVKLPPAYQDIFGYLKMDIEIYNKDSLIEEIATLTTKNN